MVFASYEFVFLFLPLVLVFYFLLSRICRSQRIPHVFLVLVSLYFYAYFNFSYIKIILSSILMNYWCAKMMAREKWSDRTRKVIMWFGVFFNVLLLGYYKYYDFFIQNINYAWGTDFMLKSILLPLGISFFTFQQLSFWVSIYKRTEKLENFTDYCLFVTFFPQLIAGPIVLYSEMMPQFVDDKRRFVNIDNLALGIYIFVIGLFKKIVIADSLAVFVDNGFALMEPGFVPAWITSFAYTLQLYFDFSGYSDMAVGIGRMLNIDLPVNFNSPYKSCSVTEFWRRWHITLGRALGTFVYIPLGGNRKGTLRTLFNLMAVFLVSGLWHGASWTFVCWGALHGLMVVVERVLDTQLARIPNIIRTMCTFFYINILWVLFRAADFTETLKIYRGMFDIGNWNMTHMSSLAADGIVNLPTPVAICYILAIILLLLFIVFFARNSMEQATLFSMNFSSALFISALFVLSTVHMSRLSVFIYFNF